MSSRTFDIIVYGATGFTGKRVVAHLLTKHPELKVAISGRNLEKLESLATSLNAPLSHVIKASENHELVHALSQAKIVLACAGPYRHIGEHIVQAAIEAKTDYLDLCGEPQFFDDMVAKYDSIAQENGVLVMSACAFDCVPAELTLKLAERTLEQQGKHMTNVEIVHTAKNISCGNPTTFHAAVDGFHAAQKGELKASRERVKSVLQLDPIAKPPKDWPKIVSSPGIMPVYHPVTDTHLIKFMGADAACILASDRYLRYRHSQYRQTAPPRLSVCLGVPSKKAAYKVLAYGGIFSALARTSFGCNLLRSNPSLFSNGFFREGGPTEDELEKATFKTFCTAWGESEKDKVLVTCEGGEPGYVATPAMIVALALGVLNHRDKIAFDSGVMLPGAAFGTCSEIYDLLKAEGIVFNVLTQENTEDVV